MMNTTSKHFDLPLQWTRNLKVLENNLRLLGKMLGETDGASEIEHGETRKDVRVCSGI